MTIMQEGARPVRLRVAGGIAAASFLVLAGAGTASSAPTAACGEYATVAPKDPAAIVASLGPKNQAYYNGYPNEISPSGFADTPAVHGPWKVGLLFGANLNDYTADAIAQMKKDFAAAKKEGLVEGELLTSWAADPSQQSPTNELAGFQDLIRAGANAIITVPLSGDAMAPVVDEAGKNGVVTVTIGGTVPSKYAINLYQNPYLNMASVVGPALKKLGGKGNVLIVRGMPIIPIDPEQFDATNSILANCPGIKVAGVVEGNFTTADTKAVVMQFLSAHPEPIDLVVQLNVMASGVISAFEQVGRKVPIVTANIAQVGDVAYVHDNKDKGYATWGTIASGGDQAEAAFRAALRVLSGWGPRTTEFAFVPTTITPDDFDKYYVAGTTINSGGEVSSQSILSGDGMDALFARPGKLGW